MPDAVETRIFGLALGHIGMAETDVLDVLNFPHLNALELPADILLSDKSSSLRKDVFRTKSLIQAGSLMPSALTQAVLMTPLRRRIDYAEEYRRNLDHLSQIGIREISLDCRMDEILGKPEAEEAFRSLLRMLAPALLKNHQTVLLPYRLPSPVPAQEMNRFLRGTMLPCVKARLDIHFGEMPPETDGAGMLRREICSVHFVYDADCGLRIQKQHVLPWLEWKDDLRIPFFLAPFSQRNRMAFQESESWDGLASDFLNE